MCFRYLYSHCNAHISSWNLAYEICYFYWPSLKCGPVSTGPTRGENTGSQRQNCQLCFCVSYLKCSFVGRLGRLVDKWSILDQTIQVPSCAAISFLRHTWYLINNFDHTTFLLKKHYKVHNIYRVYIYTCIWYLNTSCIVIFTLCTFKYMCNCIMSWYFVALR